ncbi:hypothetical protein pb186bvf_014734 [Paramecium bursaria]
MRDFHIYRIINQIEGKFFRPIFGSRVIKRNFQLSIQTIIISSIFLKIKFKFRINNQIQEQKALVYAQNNHNYDIFEQLIRFKFLS